MTQPAGSIDRNLLVAVLDRLLPEGSGFPSGGAIAADHVARALRGDAAPAALLRELDAQSTKLAGCSFTSLPPERQVELLKAAEATDAMAFGALLVHAYSGYYVHPLVVEALGLPPGAPAARPHYLEPLDPHRLDAVAARGPIYKPV